METISGTVRCDGEGCEEGFVRDVAPWPDDGSSLAGLPVPRVSSCSKCEGSGLIDPTRLSIRPIWIKSDGGRAEAGYIGDAGDCVTRAIAIAGKLDYRAVYDCLAVGMQAKSVRGKRSARDGVLPKVYKPLLAEIGFEWVLTMKIGSGCMVHLRADELPAGRLICRVSKHLCAVIDGIVYDTYDPTRDGTRCVYGYWTKV